MIIKQIYINNSLRNFHYLIACEETGQAVAIDPFDAKRVYAEAKANQFEITHIINTHEHWDHIGGNDELVKLTGATVLAHYDSLEKIPHQSVGLRAGDVVHVGKNVALRVLDTPGHTFSHVCLLCDGDEPALFCGDTLFNAGCGHCHAGDINDLYETFAYQLAPLPDNTKVYPGHDYIENNLRFTLDREPNNQAAAALLHSLNESDYDPNNAIITTMQIERSINTFFRLQEQEIIDKLVSEEILITNAPTEAAVFCALRAYRDEW